MGELAPYTEDHLLPVERLVFQSPLVRLGAFRCPVDHELFRDSGPIRDHVVVFPRTSVGIEPDDGEPFVGTPGFIVTYNQGESYRRFSIRRDADECDWYHISGDFLREAVPESAKTGRTRSWRPFDRRIQPADPRAQIRHRVLFNYASLATRADPRFVEDAAIDLVLTALVSRERRSDASSRGRQLVERAKELMAANIDNPLSIREVARELGCSIYHLSRTFRTITGTTPSRHQQQLRVTKALDSLEHSKDDLLSIALNLNFSSHSHFSSVFRQHFGMSPSEFRWTLAKSSLQ